MEWIVFFIVSWVLFALLIDLKHLKVNLWCGFFAVAMQLFVDTRAINHGLYQINGKVFSILGSSFFFVTGPVFVIGVLFAQFHPHKRWIVLVNVLVVASIFSLQELLLIFRESVVYLNWHHIDSIGVNVFAMIALSWFCRVILSLDKGVAKK